MVRTFAKQVMCILLLETLYYLGFINFVIFFKKKIFASTEAKIKTWRRTELVEY